MDRFLQMVAGCEDSCVPRECLALVISAEVDKMTRFVDISHLSLAISVIAQ